MRSIQTLVIKNEKHTNISHIYCTLNQYVLNLQEAIIQQGQQSYSIQTAIICEESDDFE